MPGTERCRSGGDSAIAQVVASQRVTSEAFCRGEGEPSRRIAPVLSRAHRLLAATSPSGFVEQLLYRRLVLLPDEREHSQRCRSGRCALSR